MRERTRGTEHSDVSNPSQGFSVIPRTSAAVEDKASPPSDLSESYVSGYVISTETLPTSNLPPQLRPLGSMNRLQTAKIKITSGPYAGKVYTLENLLSGHPAYDIPIESGASVLLNVEPSAPSISTSPQFHLADRLRSPALIFFLGLYMMGFLLMGGKKALIWLLGIFLLGEIAISTITPLLLEGYSPFLLWGVVLIGYLVLSGISHHLSATEHKLYGLTCLSTTLLTWIWMSAMIELAPLQGFLNENIGNLWQDAPGFDFKEFILISTLLAQVGLSGHLCLVILEKLKSPLPLNTDKGFIPTLKALIKVGQDPFLSLTLGWLFFVLGLHLSLFFDLTNTDALKFFNLESVATGISMGISTGAGMMFVIPVMAFWLRHQDLSQKNSQSV
ncbi:MAG: YibE/F family protein [Cyanobacteria bacterium]|nr:YibE/F family protein [Cyanobacteriota bacterium]